MVSKILADDLQVDRPIFIIGTGRNGTTLLFEVLHSHPDLAWPCQYMVGKWLTKRDRLVRKLATVLVVKKYIREKHYKRRYVSEPFDLWRKYYLGFNRPFRDLTSADCNEKTKRGIRSDFYQQLMNMHKTRFITKYTGWSRIEYVDEIFPDAHFLHVIRDGRAVAWSLLNQKWWHGWYGPSQWRWGELTLEDQELWEKSDRSFYILAGLQWKILMKNIEKKGKNIGDRYMTVKYERFLNEPNNIIAKVINWSSLKKSETFESTCNQIILYNPNEKYKNELKTSEIDKFEELLGDELSKYGYT